jgi:hypothetical protein
MLMPQTAMVVVAVRALGVSGKGELGWGGQPG